MRFFAFCSAAFLAVVTLVIACNTVDPSECWPNTSGGFGGSGTIPIGNGVGVGSGDFASPRFGPLGYGASANPCVSMGSDTTQPAPTGGTSAAAGGTGAGGGSGVGCGLGGGGTVVVEGSGGSDGGGAPDEDAGACFGKPATQYIDCRKRGLDANACSQACLEAGTGCGPIAAHPYKSGEGIGQLTWCKNGSPTYTCTYTFASGDGCAGVFAPPSYTPFWICLYK